MVTISVHLNSDPMSVGDVLAAQFQYSSHLFDNKFINYFAYTGQHRFDAISSVNTDLSADAGEVNAQTNNLSALGIGVGFTTHFFKNVLGIRTIEEKISSNFGYGFMTESVPETKPTLGRVSLPSSGLIIAQNKTIITEFLFNGIIMD